jgi:amidase
MNLEEYASYDGLGLAALVAKKEVTPSELALKAHEAIEEVDNRVNAVVETYDDRITGLDETTLGEGPFKGVPFLIKDVGGQEKGRKIEYGSRLCEGMIAEFDTNYYKLTKASGLNVIGRTNTPEYSIAGSAENLLYGNTSTPWREGYSAGGSSGGAAAAVAAGMVPLAHGSDIGGSIRIPASWCGGVGLKPSRGLISAGPVLDEGGFGLAVNFVQSKTMRDTAAMLDCMNIPQVGDPFIIRRPDQPFSTFLKSPPKKLRIAYSSAPLMDAPIDPEIATATKSVALLLEEMGHSVEEAPLPFDLEQAARAMAHFWFFGFHKRLDVFASKTGRKIGSDTLEPVVLEIYKMSREMDPHKFLDSLNWINAARREMGGFFANYDVFVSPATVIPPPPHGPYGLNHPGFDPIEYMVHGDKPIQYCFPFNVTGGPAISLPLCMHSTGMPFGIQLASSPSNDHLLIGLGAALEEALPWSDRRPPLHVSNAV